jgi:hypothetical protein
VFSAVRLGMASRAVMVLSSVLIAEL